MFPENKGIATDSYKATHFNMYPNAQKMSAYGTFRQSWNKESNQKIVFYGIKYILEKFLKKQWTLEDVAKAEKFYSTHNAGGTPYPFPKELFRKFIEENDGWFPVTIESLPEGSVVYPHVPVFQISAKGEYSRLVTFMETVLTHVWYTTNVATLSMLTKDLIQHCFQDTVDDENHWLLESRLHDFGYRGAASNESGTLGGAAHLLNFTGTDTMPASDFINSFYNANNVGQSIPATEHSVMLSWPTELDAVKNVVENYGKGLFAVVADTYDYDNFLNSILPAVSDRIKELGGTIIVRPDSGDPVTQVLKGLDACKKTFGYTMNTKGYIVLNNSGVIQGDGINKDTVLEILKAAKEKGYSAQNIAFGMGGGLLQKHNRDTLAFATKLSHITYEDGTKRDMMKLAKGKSSLPGELSVRQCRKGVPTVFPKEETGWEEKCFEKNLLEVVYDCGPVVSFLDTDTWEDIVNRKTEQWNKLPNTPCDVISHQLRKKIKIFKEEIAEINK